MQYELIRSSDALTGIRDVRQESSGLVPNVERDNQGRLTVASGRIAGIMGVKGTTVTELARQEVSRAGDGRDDTGHIVPCSCGGSGRNTDNLYPQNSHVGYPFEYCTGNLKLSKPIFRSIVASKLKWTPYGQNYLNRVMILSLKCASTMMILDFPIAPSLYINMWIYTKTEYS
jgi:hypothetical protein